MEPRTIKPGSPEWLAERRSYMCSSDSPKALGESRYGNGTDVCLEKWGEAPPVLETPQMWRGHALERAVGTAYENRTGSKIGEEYFTVHPTEPWMAGTPDAQVLSEEGKHIQIKTHNNWVLDEYGSEGTDIIPDEERIQITHELAVTGNRKVDLVVLFGEEAELQMLAGLLTSNMLTVDEVAKYILDKMDFRIFPFDRDPDLENDLVEAIKHFWFTYVVGRKWPANSQYRQDDGKMRPATPAEAQWVANLKEVKRQLFIATRNEETVKSALINLIGGNSGIFTDLGKITYKKCKDTVTEVVDWENIAKEAIEEHMYTKAEDKPEEVIIANTTPVINWEAVCKDLGVDPRLLGKYSKDVITRKGTRRFLPPTAQWNKEFESEQVRPEGLQPSEPLN